MTNGEPLCSVNICPEPAIGSDQAEVGPWLVTIYYCAEHLRERDQGTPLGPVGIDNRRVTVESLGVVQPRVGHSFPAPA